MLREQRAHRSETAADPPTPVYPRSYREAPIRGSKSRSGNAKLNDREGASAVVAVEGNDGGDSVDWSRSNEMCP
jgi:hypothetical protein